MAFDQREFRQALSQFATGVAVITARGPSDEAIGLTMSSFNSVSLDPPLILFSVDKKAYSLGAMLAAKGFAVNILSRPQEELSKRFARSLSDKWSNVQHTAGHAESPLIAGAMAHFECEPFAHHDAGDHVIFLGRVLRFAFNPAEQPLLFFRGKYHSLSLNNEKAPEWSLPTHNRA